MELWIEVLLKEQRTEMVKVKSKVFSAALTWFYMRHELNEAPFH